MKHTAAVEYVAFAVSLILALSLTSFGSAHAKTAHEIDASVDATSS